MSAPARPTSNFGLHHVALRVADLPAATRFYVELLGFEIDNDLGADGLFLTRGNDSLTLLPGHGATGPGHLDHIGFIVPQPADVAAWEAYLRAHGVTVTEPTETYEDASTGCIVLDPDGTKVQVLHHPAIAPHLTPRTRSRRLRASPLRWPRRG
jgi:catechol 2,3-dioxygenase-like lactoylglutathione lyase family enzyme